MKNLQRIMLILLITITISCKKEYSQQSISVETLNIESSKNKINLSNGLVAFYPFNGNANDMSGLGNNGIVNGATATKDRFGKNGSAYNFNGLSSKIDIPTNKNQLIYGALQPSSISLWCYKNDTTDGDLISKGWHSPVGQLGNKYLALCFGKSNSTVHFSLYDYATLNNVSSPGSYIIPGKWYNIILVRDTTMKLFINGIDVTTNPLNAGWLVNYNNVLDGSPIVIGARNNLDYFSNPYYNFYFRGKIDDIRIYNRTLNISEIIYISKN